MVVQCLSSNRHAPPPRHLCALHGPVCGEGGQIQGSVQLHRQNFPGGRRGRFSLLALYPTSWVR
uniref:Uncharacterized protein n=1 Tax=Anguilla anguilla TaxID=7936 RepID=A0A0E9TLL1_ANGAN